MEKDLLEDQKTIVRVQERNDLVQRTRGVRETSIIKTKFLS